MLFGERERECVCVRACGWRLQNHHTCVIFCQIANTIMCECVWLQEGARKCVRFKIHRREKRCACVCECVWARISMCVCLWVCAHTRAFELSRNFHLLKSKRSTSMGRWGYFFWVHSMKNKSLIIHGIVQLQAITHTVTTLTTSTTAMTATLTSASTTAMDEIGREEKNWKFHDLRQSSSRAEFSCYSSMASIGLDSFKILLSEQYVVACRSI